MSYRLQAGAAHRVRLQAVSGSAGIVAQICNRLYRRFAIGRAPGYCESGRAYRTARRMQFCDTADCKSALLLRRLVRQF